MAKVLLVEDDSTMRTLLQTFLEIEGFKVAAWKVGENPLEIARLEQPDAILMDVNLKGTNGFEILEKIRGDSALAGCKVILSSGLDYREKSLACGADHFIMKPYMPDDLIRLIKKTLQEQQPG